MMFYLYSKNTDFNSRNHTSPTISNSSYVFGSNSVGPIDSILVQYQLSKPNRSLTIVGTFDFAAYFGGHKYISDMCCDENYVYVFTYDSTDAGHPTSIQVLDMSLSLIYTYNFTLNVYISFVPYSSKANSGTMFCAGFNNNDFKGYVYKFSFDGSTLSQDAYYSLGTSVAPCCLYVDGSYVFVTSNYITGTRYFSFSSALTNISAIDLPGDISAYGYSMVAKSGYLYNTLGVATYVNIVTYDNSANFITYSTTNVAGLWLYTDNEFLYMSISGVLVAYTLKPDFTYICSAPQQASHLCCDNRFIFSNGVDSGFGDLQCHTFGRSAPGASCIARYSESI